MMNKKLAKQKFSILILVISFINIFTLFIWFFFKISPILPKINEVKNIVKTGEIKKEYDSLESFEEDIKNISDKYNITFTVEDKDNNEMTGNKIYTELSLYTFMTSVDDETYLVRTYSNKNITITSVFLGLFVFQVIVITIIFSITILFSRKVIFTPIDEIIKNIKNYKFGKKPKRTDINSEFDLIQNEFVNLTEQLDEEKLEQNRIIASISHDIKTPLTSIIGYSNLINDESLSREDIIKYNNKINDKALHIKDIVSQFDDYLLNHEKITLKLDNILISDLINELNNDYKIELENKNISFNINSDVSDLFINIDVVKIKRVFSNIISNSARYLTEGGIININIMDDKEYIKFSISDNGPGVKNDIIDKIFDPLFTTDYSRKISGLGLSICKEFITLHGGEIKAYNDNGLTITFTIPK